MVSCSVERLLVVLISALSCCVAACMASSRSLLVGFMCLGGMIQGMKAPMILQTWVI
jgi:hypothetical protein